MSLPFACVQRNPSRSVAGADLELRGSGVDLLALPTLQSSFCEFFAQNKGSPTEDHERAR